MKLLQANIWGGRLDRAITNLITAEKPDIVNLQEVISIKGVEGPMFSTLQDFQKELSFAHEFYSPVLGFQMMKHKAEWGNAILSRLPIIEQSTIFTNKDYVEDFTFEEHDYNIRNLQHAVVKHNGTNLHVLNHHGHHVAQHKNGDAESMRQCKMIAEYIKTLEGPVILSGDFNLAPQAEALQLLNGLLDNLSVRYKLKTTRTPLTHKTEVCDYIFVSKHVKVKDFYASNEVISDHQALVVDFSV